MNDFSSTWIKFDKQQSRVDLFACRTGGPGAPATPNVNVDAYDANGTMVANLQGILCTLNGPLVPVRIEAAHISYVNVAGVGGSAASGSGWAIDDLSFEADPAPQDPPPPPPVPPAPVAPDFSLNFLEGPTTPAMLAVRPGAGATRQLVVGRNDTSSGPIALSVSGLPPGVTASFDVPTPSTNRPQLVTLTLTAAASATPKVATVTVRGVPQAASAGAQPHTTTLDVIVQGQLAAYVKGIEVTQGVQTIAQPALTPYTGVDLVRSKKTVVRVYAGFLGTEAGGARPEIGMSLTGMDAGGRFLPGATLLPDWSPPPASLSLNAKFIGSEERGSASQAFVFTLPENWTTRGSIALRAQVLAAEPPSPFNRPEAAGATVCIEIACGATPARDLNRIGFRAAPPAEAISALEQRFAAVSPSGTALPDILPLDAVRTFAPLMQISPIPFTFLDAAGNASPIPRYRAFRYPPAGRIWEDADAFDMSIGRPGHSTFGAFNQRSSVGVSFTDRTSVGSSDPTGDGRLNRPLTLIAHEVMHTFDIDHADKAKADGGCDGKGGGFPTPTGRLNSVGIDTNFLSGGGVGSPPYRMIADTAAAPAYDLMSYCAFLGNGDPDSWISAQTWNQLLGAAPLSASRTLRRARAVASAAGPVLHVRAKADGGLVTVDSVRRMSAATPDSTPSAYVLVARDAEGRSVASVPMTATEVGREGAPGSSMLDGDVPAAGVASVQISSGGDVVAGRTASARPPRATFTAPRPGARTGTGSTVAVSWSASDPDGDPVAAEVAYSADGGRTFGIVYGGATGRSVRLPAALLAPSTRGRLRLRVSDGFNETEVISRPFVVAPRRPAVTILSPVTRQRVAAGSSLYLSGGAVDAAGRAVTGRRLRWFADRKPLGRGTTISAVVPAGTQRIRLEATDGSGRTGAATAAVRMRATTPFFLTLKVPTSLSRRARSFTLRASASQPARLRIGSTRAGVARSARTIRVKVRPGRAALSLKLRLTAGGRGIVQPVRIPRR